MGSSFLTTISALLTLYSVLMFFKIIVQFGLPNHPGRFTHYMVSLCAALYFSMKTMTEISLMSQMDYLRFRAIPVVGVGLGLLIQIITLVGQFSIIQQKIISRFPLMAALLVYFFMPSKADIFFIICILISLLFLTVSVGKARYQKRLFFKMSFFVAVSVTLHLAENNWIHLVGDIFLFPSLFYFFIIQQTYGVSAIVERFREEK
jgi:hypothetical protein